ncbi:MAG: DUF3089 domain-containing protein [Pseudomonadota bacterium]|nr:DUF3089 domain-containing protein [Pseudomonadota bacterium]
MAPAAAGETDYVRDTAWLCRPGRRDVCSTARLDAVTVAPDGRRTPQPFQLAADPPIDCFYVYPTISADPTPLSDLEAGPEEARITVSQAARFSSRCRLFAPVYRQISLAGLRGSMGGVQPDWSTSYADVRAAWRDYLRRDNRGRGVVLIGHSQGAIHLARLLAEEIEPNPAQHRLLVSAILAGHPGLAVPPGREVGGDLKSTPLCRTPGQTGCAVVFASYAAEDPTTRRFFGAVRGEGRSAACVNPAAPAGGKAPLRAYLPRPPLAPASDAPYLEVLGQLQAECVTDPGGSVLRVSVPPGPNALVLRSVLAGSVVLPAWGLHILDINLTQGTLLDMVDAQTRTWTSGRGRARP